MRRARIRGRGGRRRATQAVATMRARTGRAGVEFANGCPKGCILGAWIASGCRWRRRVRPEQGANGGGLGYYCIRPRPHTRSSPDPDPGPAPRPSRVFVCPPALQPSSPCRPCSSPHTRAPTYLPLPLESPDTRVSSAAACHAVSRCCAALPVLFFPFGNSFMSSRVAGCRCSPPRCAPLPAVTSY